MLNLIWTFFFFAAAASALIQITILGNPGVLDRIMGSMFTMAQTGFEISLGLTGVMTLWLGLMKIGESAGAITLLSRFLEPLFEKIFPDVPKSHPAFGAITMNLAANVLGLDNAATPLGLKAMRELQDINPEKETASNAQIMFLVINTSSVTLIPVTIFTYLYQLGYKNPTELFIPILLATSCSSLAGLAAVSFYQKINLLHKKIIGYLGGFFILITILITYMLSLDHESMKSFSLLFSNGLIFGIVILFMILATTKRVNIYEEFINGAKEGFQIAISIIPYLVAMLVAVGVFRASGVMDLILSGMGWVFAAAGGLLDQYGVISYKGGEIAFVDALPTGMMKPLSGSGARGIMIETIKTHGVDSLASRISAVMQGSTETTFYIIAVYFGSVGIKQSRHALQCGLIADLTGVTAAIVICYIFFG